MKKWYFNILQKTFNDYWMMHAVFLYIVIWADYLWYFRIPYKYLHVLQLFFFWSCTSKLKYDYCFNYNKSPQLRLYIYKSGKYYVCCTVDCTCMCLYPHVGIQLLEKSGNFVLINSRQSHTNTKWRRICWIPWTRNHKLKVTY